MPNLRRTWRWPPTVLVGVALALCTATASAQYLWRDKSGQLHASDLPPPSDVAAKDVLKRLAVGPRSEAATRAAAPAASVPPTVVAAGASRDGVDPEIEARRKKAEQADQARAKAEEDRQAALRADNCQRARAQLATLASGQRLARVNAQGERTVLDDKARADESNDARRVMASDCR